MDQLTERPRRRTEEKAVKEHRDERKSGVVGWGGGGWGGGGGGRCGVGWVGGELVGLVELCGSSRIKKKGSQREMKKRNNGRQGLGQKLHQKCDASMIVGADARSSGRSSSSP